MGLYLWQEICYQTVRQTKNSITRQVKLIQNTHQGNRFETVIA